MPPVTGSHLPPGTLSQQSYKTTPEPSQKQWNETRCQADKLNYVSLQKYLKFLPGVLYQWQFCAKLLKVKDFLSNTRYMHCLKHSSSKYPFSRSTQLLPIIVALFAEGADEIHTCSEEFLGFHGSQAGKYFSKGTQITEAYHYIQEYSRNSLNLADLLE